MHSGSQHQNGGLQVWEFGKPDLVSTCLVCALHLHELFPVSRVTPHATPLALHAGQKQRPSSGLHPLVFLQLFAKVCTLYLLATSPHWRKARCGSWKTLGSYMMFASGLQISQSVPILNNNTSKPASSRKADGGAGPSLVWFPTINSLVIQRSLQHSRTPTISDWKGKCMKNCNTGISTVRSPQMWLEGCISGRVRQSGAHSGSYPCKTFEHFDIASILS